MFKIHMLWFYVWYTNFILEIVFPCTYIMTYKAIIKYIYVFYIYIYILTMYNQLIIFSDEKWFWITCNSNFLNSIAVNRNSILDLIKIELITFFFIYPKVRILS